MKFNLIFMLSLILGMVLVSCSAEEGEIGMQEEDTLYSYETVGGDEIRSQEPEDE